MSTAPAGPVSQKRTSRKRNLVRHVRVVDARHRPDSREGVAATAARVVTLVRAQSLLLAVLERDGDIAASLVDVLAKHGRDQHRIGIAFSDDDPYCARTSTPSKSRLRMKFTTPETPSAPYSAEAPPVWTSMRSINAKGIVSISTAAEPGRPATWRRPSDEHECASTPRLRRLSSVRPVLPMNAFEPPASVLSVDETSAGSRLEVVRQVGDARSS